MLNLNSYKCIRGFLVSYLLNRGVVFFAITLNLSVYWNGSVNYSPISKEQA